MREFSSSTLAYIEQLEKTFPNLEIALFYPEDPRWHEPNTIKLAHLETPLAGMQVEGSPDDSTLELIQTVLLESLKQQTELESTVEELIGRYEEIAILYDSAELIVTITNLEELCRKILEHASHSVNMDQGGIYLVSSQDDQNVLNIVATLFPTEVKTKKVLPGEGLVGKVFETGRSILLERVDAKTIDEEPDTYSDQTSVLCVPLKVKDTVLGVIKAVIYEEDRQFNTNDLKLLSALGQLAALSIQNAYTYENAITDRLTSLYNYGYFREQLDLKLQESQQEGYKLSLLMFDIDHFKNFNDVNGHEKANVALVRVANLCLENSRQVGRRVPDLVARYGGEEFMIILQDTSLKQSAIIAERLRQTIEQTNFDGGENQPEGRLTISIGIASYPDHASTAESLINQADEALYQAKRSGRNNVKHAGQ